MANPALKELGFSSTERVAVIHADDIGMCQATLPAISDLFEFGLVSSAAVMVPCPWFQGAAAYARDHPETDLGVHLTLNSEWDDYRWSPLVSADPRAGLIDEAGYFHNDPVVTQTRADLEAVQLELQAQIHRAEGAGIDPTHIDTHMFCLGHPRFIEKYVDAGFDAGTLPVLFHPQGPGWQAFDLPQDGPMLDLVYRLGEQGIPLIDDFYMMNLNTHVERLEEAKQAFSGLSPGLTHFILHPAIDSPELRAMAPDWRCRVADYETFLSDELKTFVQSIGVQVIGYRSLRDFIS